MAKGHAEALFPMLDAMIAEAQVARGDLGQIAVVRGPGTFTGTRIGLAAARGLGLALDVPVVGLTTFECLAAAGGIGPGNGVACAVAIDARRGEIYLQVLGPDLAALTEAEVTTPESAAARLPDRPLVAIGSGAEMLAEAALGTGRKIASRPSPERDGALVARLGAAREPASHPPLPLYLRPPDAKLPEPVTLRAAGRTEAG
jgi:tRNA threonylcarbamoyladenosine biosynthesis protein TsaB